VTKSNIRLLPTYAPIMPPMLSCAPFRRPASSQQMVHRVLANTHCPIASVQFSLIPKPDFTMRSSYSPTSLFLGLSLTNTITFPPLPPPHWTSRPLKEFGSAPRVDDIRMEMLSFTFEAAESLHRELFGRCRAMPPWPPVCALLGRRLQPSSGGKFHKRRTIPCVAQLESK